MAECSFIDYRLQSRGVVVLTLDNPPLNLTTLVTLDKLLSACRDIAGDERVRAVVVTGSGSKAFCADISEFASPLSFTLILIIQEPCASELIFSGAVVNSSFTAVTVPETGA